MQKLSGLVDNEGITALINLFSSNFINKIDFGSRNFKMLWEKEKNIGIERLKMVMRKKPEQKKRIIASIPEAAFYYV